MARGRESKSVEMQMILPSIPCLLFERTRPVHRLTVTSLWNSAWLRLALYGCAQAANDAPPESFLELTENYSENAGTQHGSQLSRKGFDASDLSNIT